MNKGKGIKYVKRKDVDYAWRCFEHLMQYIVRTVEEDVRGSKEAVASMGKRDIMGLRRSEPGPID